MPLMLGKSVNSETIGTATRQLLARLEASPEQPGGLAQAPTARVAAAAVTR